ncbi:MAG: hypoxanthine phosphoribosyltransferase [Candidatus Kapabacteria bacterium]|nr:hypoxanthine phosphoribosyltransferase [Candidatus Kapabacteria bacterium]
MSNDIIRVHDRTFRPYIHRHEIDEIVSNLATRINRDFAGQELVVLIILKGAMIFAADLVRKINVPCVIETLRASSYRDSMSSGILEIEAALPNVTDRNVLIVEDIIDTGKTVIELTKVLAGMSPACITVATLLSKPASQVEPMAIEYVGREIASDFVVGYGMDYAGYGRELDAIWVVNPDTEE